MIKITRVNSAQSWDGRTKGKSRAYVAGADYDRYDNAYDRLDVSDTRLLMTLTGARIPNRHGHYFAMYSEIPRSRILLNHDSTSSSARVRFRTPFLSRSPTFLGELLRRILRGQPHARGIYWHNINITIYKYDTRNVREWDMRYNIAETR